MIYAFVARHGDRLLCEGSGFTNAVAARQPAETRAGAADRALGLDGSVHIEVRIRRGDPVACHQRRTFTPVAVRELDRIETMWRVSPYA